MQLYTPWGRSLDPDHILPAYPRSQLRRTSYMNLNGSWQYAFTSCASHRIPESWTGTILVPFSPETALSGVLRQLQPDEYLWYRRMLPETTRNQSTDRVILHFGAVDQSCVVYVNGQEVATHTGGYLPFSADITDYLHTDLRPDELVVRVRDLSDTSYYARGKQKLKNGGMYYRATSGIWQTVWLEIIPAQHILNLVLEPLIDECAVSIRAVTSDSKPCPIIVDIFSPRMHTVITDEDGEHFDMDLRTTVHGLSDTDLLTTVHDVSDTDSLITIHGLSDTNLLIPVPDVHLWDTEHPWLYNVRIRMGEDTVISYFAMRKIGIEKDEAGIPRICLNHRPLFLRGVLDQGYWPESYYTPPADEAMIFDLTEMKRFGFNMVRKHAKIEPDRWYYHCDRLGLLVWQDIVNGGDAYDDYYVTIRPNLWNWKNTTYKTYDENKTGRGDPQGHEAFRQEMTDTVRMLYNHPSIFSWTLFNEGWGQFETQQCTDLLRSLDSSRPIDAASGWFDQHHGDFKSVHNYFFPFRIYPEHERAFVLSEFGGLPLLLKDHSTCEKLYGYGKKYKDSVSLSGAYHRLNQSMEKYISRGLCATVYTQWTDIEDEVNGIYTWDREVKKME